MGTDPGMEPLYAITFEDDVPALITASALMNAWSGSVPDLAALALDLPVGRSKVVFMEPWIEVRRVD